MSDYYTTEENKGSKIISNGVIAFILVLITLATAIIWCFISAVSCYYNSIKINVKKEYDDEYSFKKGLPDLRNTIIGYWHNIVEYSDKCFSKNNMHKIIGVCIYPFGFIFLLFFALLHLVILRLYPKAFFIFNKR